MEKVRADIINDTEHLLYDIHMGRRKKLCNLCSGNILWKYNHNCSEGILNDEFLRSITELIKPDDILKMEYLKHCVYRQNERIIYVTGIYCIHKSEGEGIRRYNFDYTIHYANGLAYFISIMPIQNNNIPTKIYSITGIRETVYNFEEAEILYVEAMGSHTLWHCVSMTVEAVIPLKSVEDKLSENFVKIHRSYIVNRKMVREIRRCVAIMKNGDEMPIPYKKYVSVKERLRLAW